MAVWLLGRYVDGPARVAANAAAARTVFFLTAINIQPTELRMFRRVVALTMLVSFVAMATSGAMMYAVEKPSFTIQMHPVHKVFGMLMVFAAIAHITLNFRSIKAHLKLRSGIVAASILSVLLVLLYAAAINNTVPPDLARQMDAAAEKVEERGE